MQYGYIITIQCYNYEMKTKLLSLQSDTCDDDTMKMPFFVFKLCRRADGAI